MGINLVRMLLDKGHFVRSYDIAPFAYPEADQVDVLRGDIRDMGLHDQAFDGIDVMVHCAAALPLCDQAEIMSTNVDGTRMLLETARAKGTARFIHISTTAVYGIPDHHPLIEEDPMIGVGPYGASKVRAEEVCQEFRAGGMCLPVLRPKSFVGPERLGAFELLYDFACDGHGFPVLGIGEQPVSAVGCGGSERCGSVVCNAGRGGCERYVQRGRGRVRDIARELSGGAGPGRAWPARCGLSRRTGDCSAADAGGAGGCRRSTSGFTRPRGRDSFVSTDKLQSRLGWAAPGIPMPRRWCGTMNGIWPIVIA